MRGQTSEVIEGIGREDSVPIQWVPALFCVAWLVISSLIWYANRDNIFGSKQAVVPIFGLGMMFYMALLTKSLGMKWKELSRETLLIVGSGVVLLSLLWLYGRRGSYPFRISRPDGLEHLYTFFYFSFCCVFFRMIIPLGLAKWFLKRSPKDYGYSPRGTFRHAWIYALALLLAVPMVWYASTLSSFIQKYPLCKNAIQGGTLSIELFAIYHVAYAFVFISGESYWRGFLLFGVGRQFGRNAFFLMLIPYVACHFGKPMLETFGAIFAGLFLGYLAWEHRSFWLGFLLHWGVALMMDLFALDSRGTKWVWEWL